MTIADEITALSGRIQAAYVAAEEMGATIPATKDTANLSATIESIPQGGGGDVVFAMSCPRSGDGGGGVIVTVDGTTYPPNTYPLIISSPSTITLQSQYWGATESHCRVQY